MAAIPKFPDRWLINAGHYFQLLMFWLENIVWLSLFMVYEALLSPFVYFKTLIVVAWATQGLFMTIWNTFAWMVAGPIYIVFFILRDTQYLFRIFLMHKGCRAANNIKDELATEQFPIMDEVNCFNEARHIVLEKYREHIKKAREASMKDEA